jgi:16S rRNA (guanine966-N2)-methyltransferase
VRIVGGDLRGRKLQAPGGKDLRPTSDRARESVFNILSHGQPAVDLDGVSVVDVFAGTGALGLEALSRGAAHATFIDSDPRSLKFVQDNAAQLGIWKQTTRLKFDARRLAPPPRAAKAPCAVAFLDAPYNQELTTPALQGLINKGWVKAGAICVVETEQETTLEPPRGYRLIEDRTYGAARVSFLEVT